MDKSTTFELSDIERKVNTNEFQRLDLEKEEEFEQLAELTRAFPSVVNVANGYDTDLAVHEHEYHLGGIMGEVEDNIIAPAYEVGRASGEM